MKQEKENSRIVLSIALLASNRKTTIEKCLDSLAPIRNAVSSELIILDTGCDRDVRTLLEKHGDIVKEFTWCNDFSKARNETLRYAHGEWYLYLDDDEWFTDTGELIRFFTSGEYKKYGRASYIQRNYLDMEASQYTDSWVDRMIRLEEDTHFESKIHEFLTPKHGESKTIHSIVDHFGYVYPDEKAKMNHFMRNKILLEEMMKEEPDELRWRLQMIQEYRAIEDFSSMDQLGQTGIDMIDRKEKAGVAGLAEKVYRGTFYAAQILSWIGRQDYSKALELCWQFGKDEKNTPLFHVAASLWMAQCSFYTGDYEETIRQAEEYLKQRNWAIGQGDGIHEQLLAPFVGECLDLIKKKEVCSLLICAGLKLQNTIYLETYLKELKWDEKNIYVHEDIVQTMIEAMNRIPEKPVFSKVLKLIYAHKPFWQYFCEQLTIYEQAGHPITEIMNVIHHSIPEAVQRSGTASENQTAEMQKLSGQIKQQIEQLMENGMPKQALNVLEQMQKILPEDDGWEEIERRIREQMK